MKPDFSSTMKRLIFALDVPAKEEEISEYVDLVGGKVSQIKVNSVFTGNGPLVLKLIGDSGSDVFLDLKFHDIPFTVVNHVTESAGLRVRMLTMHSDGGPDMIHDSVEALEKGFGKDRPLVLVITILTSINKTLMNWWMGIPGTVEEEVVRRSMLAMMVGADGVVCSPNEAAAVRRECGEDLLIVTPGIRFSGEEERDQKRVNTPRAAIANGSDMLVMGSDLRKGNPEKNVTRAIQEIELGLQDRLK